MNRWTVLCAIFAFQPLLLVAAIADLPPVSKTYFPRHVPLLELEFMTKRSPSVRFRPHPRWTRKAQEGHKKQRTDEWKDTEAISRELSEVVYEELSKTYGGWGGGGNFGFRKSLWIPFVGYIIIDSNKRTHSMSIDASPRTLADWEWLSKTKRRETLVTALEEKFEECQKNNPDLCARWIKPPCPPVGLCEMVYQIKQIGPPPPHGAPEIDLVEERQKARDLKRSQLRMMANSLFYKLQGKQLKDKLRVVAAQRGWEERKKTPSEILSEAGRDALDDCRPWINAYSGSDRQRVNNDTVHIFSYYGTENAKDGLRARKIIQKAIEEKAAEYPDWFEVSFPTGDKSVSFLTMEEY